MITKLSPFAIQHNMLSDIYFCDMRFRVVGLPHVKQSDLRTLAFIVILSIYTRTCFGICLSYFNIGLRCSSLCDLQTIANDVRKAEKT